MDQSPSDANNYLRITDVSGNNAINLAGATSTPYNYTATYSGQIRIYNCSSNNSSRILTIAVTGGSNTQDDQTAQGTNQWIAHIYKWTGGAPPANAFVRYIGIYKTEAETFSENFGGDAGCVDVLSASNVRIQIDRSLFAVRFQNKSTRLPGAYIATFTGDDGMRFYSDGTKYFDAWVEQGSTAYTKQLFPITANGNLLFEYYENGGGNVAYFTDFARVVNTVTPTPDQVLCAGGTVTPLTGNSTFADAPLSSDNNFAVTYQWQSSTDSVTWTSISGATSQNYTPLATVGSFYYRRIANVSRNNTNKTGTPTTISVSVADPSNAVRVTVRPTPTATISGTTTVCMNATQPAVVFTNPQALPVVVNYTAGGAAQNITVPANGTASVTQTTAAAGNFTYTLNNVQYQSAPACSATISGSATITVQTLPAVTFTGDATVCQNEPKNVVFTNSGSAAISVNYTLNGGASQTVNVAANSTTAVAVPTGTAGTYQYSLTSAQYTTAPACSTAVTGTATVIVRPTPTATVSVPATVCQNGTANATFTNPQALPVTITYKIGSGANQTLNVGASTTATVPVTTTTAGTITYTLVSVQYQTAPNCSANVTGTASVIVRTLPNGTISAPAICQGQVARITFTATAGTGPYSLVINSQTYNNITSGTAFNASPPPAGTTTYNLTQITDANTCVRTTP